MIFTSAGNKTRLTCVYSSMERKERPFDVIGQLAALRRYARSLVRNSDEAEDLVHDALVRAFEKRKSFRSGGNLRTGCSPFCTMPISIVFAGTDR